MDSQMEPGTACAVAGCLKPACTRGRCVGYNCSEGKCAECAEDDSAYYQCQKCRDSCLVASMFINTDPAQMGICGVKIVDAQNLEALTYMRDAENVPCVLNPNDSSSRTARNSFISFWERDAASPLGFSRAGNTCHLENAKTWKKKATQTGIFHRALLNLANSDMPGKKNPYFVPTGLDFSNLKLHSSKGKPSEFVNLKYRG